MIIAAIESENGEQRFVRMLDEVPIPDPTSPEHVLQMIEWWGGPCDGDPGVIRLTRDDALTLRDLSGQS